MGVAFLIFMSIVLGTVLFEGAWTKMAYDTSKETANTPHDGAISSQARLFAQNMILAQAEILKNCSETNGQSAIVSNGCASTIAGVFPSTGSNPFSATNPENIEQMANNSPYGLIMYGVFPATVIAPGAPNSTADFAYTTFFPKMQYGVVICKQIHQYLETLTKNSRSIGVIETNRTISLQSEYTDSNSYNPHRLQSISPASSTTTDAIMSYSAQNQCPILVERIDN